MDNLKKDLRSLGYDYIRVSGVGQEDGRGFYEDSLFVKGVDDRTPLDLGKKYN